MVKGIYLRRKQFIIGSLFYQILPKLIFLSENLTSFVGGMAKGM